MCGFISAAEMIFTPFACAAASTANPSTRTDRTNGHAG